MSERRLVTLALFVATFLVALDTSVVATAMPTVMEQHHGRIWAQSAGEGTGTVISVWLPEHRVTHTRGNAAAA